MLTGFSLLMAFNQVVIKATNGGFQPVFSACVRSTLALCVLVLWMRWKGISIRPRKENFWPGLILGLLFAFEFVFLFMALDYTTVSRVSVLFYTMPIWLAISAHFLLPNEDLTKLRTLGLGIAMVGVVWAFFDRSSSQAHSLTGDLLAVGAAVLWAGIALCARLTSISKERPETQLFIQLLISAPILFVVALFFGPFVRDLAPVHWAGLAFQSFIVASFGFLFWLKLIATYQASAVASFSFL